jgi:AraC-like DNA-binding protein
MQYQKFSPNKVLSEFVECYFVWESGETITDELVIESPPTGFGSIVVNYGSPYFLQNKKYDRLAVPAQFISGQSIYSYKLSMKGDIRIAGIVLKPAGLSSFFGLSGYEYVEERIDLFKAIPYDYAKTYVDKLKNADSAKNRATVLEEFLLYHYSIHKPQTDYIDQAANIIVAKNGMVHMQELLKESHMSRRSFERKFFEKVGLSPKYYARIRRIGYVLLLTAGKRK